MESAGRPELRRGSNGTRWTNEQLLFHMLFGYLLVRNLLWLVRAFGRLPDAASRGFAALLNAATRPFHVVNYLGSLGGPHLLGSSGMERVMDTVTASLIRFLERADDRLLARGMHFPTGWDPYFQDYMTVQEVLHYATVHYQHHRRQLTLHDAHDV
ncbi:DinB family protein [Intrasporangium zincisolvens]|uniref:DinB family protein n=1 Tax=Intrasporangium zincisolvens TaxID=3080018 RepID=UPI0039B73821